MDDTSARLKSGAIITIAAVVFTGLIFYVGDFRRFARSTKVYKAHFTDLQFVNIGQAVTVAGVRIGRISEVIPPHASEKRGSAMIRIEVDNALEVRTDAALTVRRDGLLGERFLELTLGQAAAPLPPGDEILFTSIEPTMADLGKQFETLRPHFVHTLENVDRIVADVKVMMESGELRDIMHEAKVAITDLQGHAKDVKAEVIATLDEAQAAVAELRAVVQKSSPDVKATTEELRKVAEGLGGRLDEVKLKLVETLASAQGLVVGQRESMIRSIDNIEEATWYAKNFARKLNENPSVLLFGADDQAEAEPKRDGTQYRKDGRLPPFPREP